MLLLCYVGFQVRFANGLRQGTDFTITDTQPNLLTLDLAEGSLWQRVSCLSCLYFPLLIRELFNCDASECYQSIGHSVMFC